VPDASVCLAVVWLLTGKIDELHWNLGYGFISPDGGGPRVLMSVDDLDGCVECGTGTPVRFSCLQGARGLKAYNVRILPCEPLEDRDADDVDFCSTPGFYSACSPSNFIDEIASVLSSTVPEITAAQISSVSKKLSRYASRRGWLSVSQ
jgi:cold shock CspA family protein